MTPQQVDALIAKIPDDLDTETRDAVMAWLTALKDPEMGAHAEQLLRATISAGGWQQLLDYLDTQP